MRLTKYLHLLIGSATAIALLIPASSWGWHVLATRTASEYGVETQFDAGQGNVSAAGQPFDFSYRVVTEKREDDFGDLKYLSDLVYSLKVNLPPGVAIDGSGLTSCSPADIAAWMTPVTMPPAGQLPSDGWYIKDVDPSPGVTRNEWPCPDNSKAGEISLTAIALGRPQPSSVGRVYFQDVSGAPDRLHFFLKSVPLDGNGGNAKIKATWIVAEIKGDQASGYTIETVSQDRQNPPVNKAHPLHGWTNDDLPLPAHALAWFNDIEFMVDIEDVSDMTLSLDGTRTGFIKLPATAGNHPVRSALRVRDHDRAAQGCTENWDSLQTIGSPQAPACQAASPTTEDNLVVGGAVNNPPTCNDVDKSTPYETPVEIQLDCTDLDPGDTLSYGVTDNPDHGTLGPIGADGKVTYTPGRRFSDQDEFKYYATDGADTSAAATVRITVEPNNPPICNDVDVSTPYETPVEIQLDCSDAETTNLTYRVVRRPTNGTLGSISSDGKVTYTPNTGYSGPDEFTYKANDGTVDSNVATVTITVGAAPNQNPDLWGIGYLSQPDDARNDWGFSMIAFGTDPDAGDSLKEVELTYGGFGTGAMMVDQGGGLFGLGYPNSIPIAGGSVPDGGYGISAQAEDQNGARSLDTTSLQVTPTPSVPVDPGYPVDFSCPAERTVVGQPKILLGGFGRSRVSASTGGTLQTNALVSDPQGLSDIQWVEIYFNGVETGLVLKDDGLNGDLGANDGFYGLTLPVPAGVPAGSYQFTIRAGDNSGHISTPWPCLNIYNGAPASGAPPAPEAAKAQAQREKQALEKLPKLIKREGNSLPKTPKASPKVKRAIKRLAKRVKRKQRSLRGQVIGGRVKR